MSCIGFLSDTHRAALAASSAGGPPLSAFTSPPASETKVRRVRALASSASPAIRESAGLAYHAPIDVLEVLAADSEVTVRSCVARNSRTPEWVLRSLAADPSAQVRGWVVANRTCPPALLDVLAEDDDEQVRTIAAWARRWD